MEFFSNREWALFIWGSAVAIFILVSPKAAEVRKAARSVFSAFFVRKIQFLVFLMLAYMVGIIYFLHDFGLWNLDQIKNTLIWAATFGFVSLFKLESIKNNKSFFKQSIIDNLKLIAVVEFVVGIYSFSIGVEILIVPSLFIISLTTIVADENGKYSHIKHFFENILSLFGILIITYTLYMLFKNFSLVAQEQTIYDFMIPPLLTLLYLPFIFIMMLYSTYEQVFVRLKFFIKIPRLRTLAKVYAVNAFNFRIGLLERWASTLPYTDTSSNDEIKNSIKKIFIMKAAEKTPVEVPVEDGWSPYKAKKFLDSNGFETGFYHESFDGWFASSPMVEFGEGLFPNSISYVIGGNEKAVKFLKLKLYVKDNSQSQQAHEKLLMTAKKLYEAAIKSELPLFLQESIVKGVQIEHTSDNFRVELQMNKWPKHRFNGYDLNFIITRI